MDKERAEIEKLVDKYGDSIVEWYKWPTPERMNITNKARAELLAALTSSLDVGACVKEVWEWHCFASLYGKRDERTELEQILTSHIRPTEWSKEKPTEPGWYWFRDGTTYYIGLVYRDGDKLRYKCIFEDTTSYDGQLSTYQDGEWQLIK